MFGAIKAGYKVGQTPSVEYLFFKLAPDAVPISQKQ